MNNKLRKTINIGAPLLLSGAILYWMYRGVEWSTIEHVLWHEMNWWWMLASFPFGILAQMFRGWRWKQSLAPLGEHPRTSTAIYSIFISYAASLLVPRIGEFTRCGVLKRWEGTSFPKALGTVVTERAVDSLIIFAITMLVFLCQLPVFLSFFNKTGTRFDELLGMFSATGYVVTLLCAVMAFMSLYVFRKKLAFYDKVKSTLRGILDGIMSLRGVSNVPLFLFYSVAIWAAYFLHYYLTFFCFAETAHLGLTCAAVTFIVGSIAVLVPTPNGAGSWHFAVKTMLILYGVADAHALFFVLIVHTVQTALVALLGVFGFAMLSVKRLKD
ncbi:MAG: flippase-like domain-containing protein [Prevotella sp.]|nr:flippase-like domain-containing protein [Prevotella sp.]